MNDVLSVVCKKHNLTIIQIEPGDKYCQANGEEVYINNCRIGGRDIELGIYDNDEFKLISFFHELGHRLIPHEFWKECGYNTLLGELECWRLGIIEAKKFGVLFSDAALEFGYMRALSYVGHDERERSDWHDECGSKLWINKHLKLQVY